ncbi:MAG: ribosome small subunit-dependent GTPase A [Firmicutes bacterium]|nr:ribosome small subunit-dependent GTPase A [Bacillota bacterium]
MQKGIVIKAMGGFYFVDTPLGIYPSYIRGRLKRKTEVMVGDKVKIKPLYGDKAIIEEVLPRQNKLVRPAIVNIDQGIIVMSMTNPALNLNLLDRFLVLVQAAGLRVIICFNKIDLSSKTEVERITKVYRRAKFIVIPTSAKSGEGIDVLREILENKITVLAGPSGAGKSSILNCIQPGFSLQTGQISRKLGRGRHTTRHVELLSLAAGGRVADTPGFTSLDLGTIGQRELMYYYPEFMDKAPECRFPGCLHWQEPGCAVLEAVEKKQIDGGRYKRYLELLQELEG